jgi:branched-subunit amino acid transport protein
VSSPWLVVVLVGVATVVLKGLGPVVLGGRSLPPGIGGAVSMLAPALLAALVVTQAFSGDRKLIFDERLFGLAAAVVAIRLRAPLLAVVVIAAGVTAAARAL